METIRNMPEAKYHELFTGTFFEELAGEIDIIEPNNELAKNENVIDQMTDLEKRLYSLSAKYGRTAGIMCIQAKYEKFGEGRDKMITAGEWSELVSKVLLEILWVIIRERLEISYSFLVGVRYGFQVVSFPPPPKYGIENFFKKEIDSGTFIKI